MNRLSTLLGQNQEQILDAWLEQQLSGASREKISERELRSQSRDFLQNLIHAMSTDTGFDSERPEWKEVQGQLSEVSRSRAKHGYSPSETAKFVFSLKRPVYDLVRRSGDTEAADDIWTMNLLLDSLGLYTTELFQKSREEVIRRQQQELLELSTPVVQLWEGLLAIPLIGSLDSARTQTVMENLLQRIVETGAAIAIIDITGVPMVDTLVAQHLLKTVAAARLMGADCIISGIRPQIAQTIVHLGVELNVATKATLADAFAVALKRLGKTVVKAAPAPEGA
jgi:rsbT co-antagonist protein RsbR